MIIVSCFVFTDYVHACRLNIGEGLCDPVPRRSAISWDLPMSVSFLYDRTVHGVTNPFVKLEEEVVTPHSENEYR